MTELELRTELMTSIQNLSEADLQRLSRVMEKDFPEASIRTPVKKRKAGTMKGMLKYMADDFDAPLEDFKDYMY
ncbi:MAG: DUF2281 domain-containing protein [Bacteroidota bacterium]